MERIETVIVGGGQAGLATSYYLAQHRREHVVFERAARAGNAWRTGRWDSFTLVTPNWTLRMPGAEYAGTDPHGYLPRDAVVAYFEQYAERFTLPVRYNATVISIESTDRQRYRVQTTEDTVEARNVVIATGLEQLPKIPPLAGDLSPEITQLPSSSYRNPDALPPGAVLVVGSAQSGCQIAEELYQSGRAVYLCTSGAGRAPRCYRGKDVFEWLFRSGFFDIPPERLPFPKERFVAPHLSGKNGGHTLNLHQFARDGVTLLGHLRGAADGKILLAADLHANLGQADRFERELLQRVDGYLAANRIDAPAETMPQLRDGYDQPLVEELDLRAAGIGTIIWATGYRFDFSLVKLPLCDETGFPIQKSGVTNYPGLYFVGMPWMPTLKPGMLAGVAESAAHITSRIIPPSHRNGKGAEG